MAYDQKEKDEKFSAIFQKMENGASLRSALIDEQISSSTFYKWIEQDAEKAKQYARACEERADKIADEILDIADFTDRDTIETDEGAEIPNHEWIQRSKLRVDTRKWLLGKLNPKKYGDKLDISSKITMEQPLFGD